MIVSETLTDRKTDNEIPKTACLAPWVLHLSKYEKHEIENKLENKQLHTQIFDYMYILSLYKCLFENKIWCYDNLKIVITPNFIFT